MRKEKGAKIESTKQINNVLPDERRHQHGRN
jgi:hypothetical protein